MKSIIDSINDFADSVDGVISNDEKESLCSIVDRIVDVVEKEKAKKKASSEDCGQYLTLPLNRHNLTIQVKIEDEGLVLDAFTHDGCYIDGKTALWEELVNEKWGLKLSEILNNQHNTGLRDESQ